MLPRRLVAFLREGRPDESMVAKDPASLWDDQRDEGNRFALGAHESDIFLPGMYVQNSLALIMADNKFALRFGCGSLGIQNMAKGLVG